MSSKTADSALALNPTLESHRAEMGFERLRFEHFALPELDMDEIDLGTTFLGRSVQAPLLISSLTGGIEQAAVINTNLAAAARRLGVALAAGSPRNAIEGRGLPGSIGRCGH
ncbi:alpha-hydroxy-acid oxidizing protein [Consotaella salsifontis]|uniref:Isopentenyl-diphosphate delta-isomerase n=1 Tax=Consotaella salsifontis TaxID=1365950 RepID=A0A1T4TCU8_9HYPH|nr:alpha-hydroxy-acid oxidizing protein [Consotaella salsifontis]SKA38206.1 isopentenyl-diphosphate delta-isomerase [Consotaella salsifontis]